MKWFFSWCQDTEFRTDHNWQDLIRVAVESARRNTGLEPHLIYDGDPSPFTDELAAQGVKVIFHRLSFTAELTALHADNPQYLAVARGTFLRFDIPLLAAPEDELVLYTDADVMFQSDPDFLGYMPPLLAAAPEFKRGSRSEMNAGILLLNLRGFRAIYEQFMAFVKDNLHRGMNDQDMLRAMLGPNYTLLPDLYNWKPYWGVNPEAPILHWHGPKPVTIAGLLDGSVTWTHEAWKPLFEQDRQAYAHYVDLYQGFLASYGEAAARLQGRPDLISRGKPATQSSLGPLSRGATSGADAAGALNGVLDGAPHFCTDLEDSPWWQLDLGAIATITEIHIHNTADAHQARFRDFTLSVSIDGQSWAELAAKRDGAAVVAPYIWAGPGTAWARYVRITLLARDYLHLCQVEVFGRLP